jgi:hypothetical protein
LIELPSTSEVPVVRVDFSDEAAWASVRAALLAPADDGSGYEAKLAFVDWPALSGRAGEELEAEVPRDYPSSYEHPFMVVVDAVAIKSAGYPVLLVDLSEDETSGSFRAIAREVAAIEANLTLANMDFSEFADSVEEDGVFRGFE